MHLHPTGAGRPSFALMLALSLGVHAALCAVVWQWRLSPMPAARDLQIELSQHAGAAHEPIRSPGERSDPRPAKHVGAVAPRSAPAPVAATLPSRPNAAQSSDSAAQPASVQAESAVAQMAGNDQDSPEEIAAVELRVLDWLARFRVYPLAARRAHIEGTVHLRATLMPDGRLTERTIEATSGHDILDASALELLGRASPLPATLAGRHMREIDLHLPIAYRLAMSR